jgi:uncharacterized membrane protein HdeD (DUF308 family)
MEEMLVTNPFRRGSWTRGEVDAVSRRWWLLAVNGAASVVAGGIIVLTDWTVDDLAWFIGALLVIRGTFTLFTYPVDASARTWSIGHGLVELGVGIAVWVWPDPTLLVIAAFLGWLLLLRGTMAITGSITARRFIPYWGVILAAGIGEVVAAFYLLSRPGLTLVAAVLAVGAVSIAYGMLQVILAFEIKNLPGRLDDLARRLDDADRKMTVTAIDSAPQIAPSDTFHACVTAAHAGTETELTPRVALTPPDRDESQ